MEDLFDPISEFQVLETFEYQEEVQRPEELRFFTLDEQLQDYFESRIPAGRMTKYQTRQLATELDRLRDAYTRTIELTDTDYNVRPRAAPRMPSWVRPLLETPTLTTYNYKTNWAPLFADQLTLANYYPRMLAALPRPYSTPTSDHPAIQSTTIGHLDDDAKTELRGLGDYMRTKSVLHEDGRLTVTSIPMPNTRDDLRTRGFLLSARGVDLPNPLPDHPFLESTQVRTLITDEPFEEVYPSIDAIMTHAVPTTTDPYGEGLKFLKVYDVKLSEIPWDAWKSRFPSVDTISDPPAPISIAFPASESTVPSENIRGLYTIPWMPGYESRYWLQQQDDAGQLVVKMLLSRASTAGLLPVQPIGEVIEPQYPNSTPEECLVTDSFDTFLNSGVYRSDRCIPLSSILQERKNLIASGRLAWKDGTENEILSSYQRTLQSFQLKEPGTVSSKTYETIPSRGIPQLRREILIVLKDPARLDEDKLDAIQTLLKDIIATKQVYLSADGSFLICGHTLATLKGDLEKDEYKFYRDWTGIDAGQRVCLHCGERIGQVFVQQDEFDDEGHLVVSHSALDRPSFQGETAADTLTYSLRKLQGVFQMDVVSENVFYTLLSILQILPTSEQLLSVLTVIRSISGSLRKASKNADFTNRTDGILGLAGVLILIQGYLLTPGKFQSLRYSGFPRDTKETEKRGIVDSLIYVLKSTFEAFPASFRGSVAPFFRAVLTKPKDVRKETLQNVQRIVERHFKSLMESAREQYVQAGDSSLDEDMIEQPLFRPSERPERPPASAVFTACPQIRPMITLEPKSPPNVVQPKVPLKYGLLPGNSAKALEPEPLDILQVSSMPDAEIRKRIKLGFPASLKLPDLKTFIESMEDGFVLASVLHRVLDALAENSTVPAKTIETIRAAVLKLKVSDVYRDSVRGLFYELLHAISKLDNVIGITQQLQLFLKHDIGVRMLFLSKDRAEKEQQELRASERETLKERLRRMDDTRRELTKLYLDMGIAAHIVTPQDRELFFKNRQNDAPDPEKEYAEEAVEADEDRPEEGYVSVRDYVDNGDVPTTDAGAELGVDYGDYGDRAVRDYDDYADVGGRMDDDEGYGA